MDHNLGPDECVGNGVNDLIGVWEGGRGEGGNTASSAADSVFGFGFGAVLRNEQARYSIRSRPPRFCVCPALLTECNGDTDTRAQ